MLIARGFIKRRGLEWRLEKVMCIVYNIDSSEYIILVCVAARYIIDACGIYTVLLLASSCNNVYACGMLSFDWLYCFTG